MPSFFPLSIANPLPRLFDPASLSAQEEEERKRKEQQAQQAMEQTARESQQAQQAASAAMPNPGAVISTMKPPVPQDIPAPPLTQRFGMSRLMLGDKNPIPQGDTFTSKYQDYLEKGPPRQGILSALGNMLVPGAMRAATDTYEEKAARLGEAARQEQEQGALNNQTRYYDAMENQAQARVDAAQAGAGAKVESARINQQRADYATLMKFVQSGMKLDARPISEEQIPTMEMQGFIIVRDPQGRIIAYRNAEDASLRNAAGTIKNTEIKEDAATGRAEATNETRENVAKTGASARLGAAKIGADASKSNTAARNETALRTTEMRTSGGGKSGGLADEVRKRIAERNKGAGNPQSASSAPGKAEPGDEDVVRETVKVPGKRYEFSDGSVWKLVNGKPTRIE